MRTPFVGICLVFGPAEVWVKGGCYAAITPPVPRPTAGQIDHRHCVGAVADVVTTPFPASPALSLALVLPLDDPLFWRACLVTPVLFCVASPVITMQILPNMKPSTPAASPPGELSAKLKSSMSATQKKTLQNVLAIRPDLSESEAYDLCAAHQFSPNGINEALETLLEGNLSPLC